MEFNLPNLETVLDIHTIVIDLYGGLHGVPHPEYIEAALMRPQHYMLFTPDCDIHLVAAILLDSIARNHAFADGNKRTALITMLMIYNLNGYKQLRYDLHMNEKFEELVLDVTRKKPTISLLRVRLKNLILEFSE